ncbi:hypothetical protein C8233_05580 [Halomonas sp. SF2003]|nr:hypothetical protein C8233_05580 [Halomonas sp. SF2003]
MKMLNTLIAATALSFAATGAAFADSVADLQVRSALSESSIHGQAQSAAAEQATFADTGMSVAAGRVESSLNDAAIEGQRESLASDAQQFVNDAGKSVSATRVQHALSESV